MLEGRIAPRLSLRVERVGPLVAIVAALFRIVAGKQPVGEVVAVADDPGGIGVLAYVLLLNAIMFDGIVNHAADEGDVGARAQFCEHIGYRARTIETRIDVENIGAALLGAR